MVDAYVVRTGAVVGRVRIISGAYAYYLGTVALAYVSSARS